MDEGAWWPIYSPWSRRVRHNGAISLSISLSVYAKKSMTAKWLSVESLQIVRERREVINKGERERYIQLNEDFQRTAPRDKKSSSINSV